MRDAVVIELEVDRAERMDRLYREYCGFPVDLLKENTLRVQKRLGPQNTKLAIDLLDSDRRDAWLDVMLQYYDKTYDHARNSRHPDTIQPVPFSWMNAEESLNHLIKFLN